MSTDRQLKGLVIPHYRDSDNWRLRAFRERNERKKHPIDPAWELGQYRKCYTYWREKVRSEYEDYRYVIFDTVRGETKSAVIRSVFEISDVKGSTLVYNEFWFCVGKPMDSPSRRNFRAIMKLCSNQTEKWLNKIKSSRQYKKYKTPAKNSPASVSRQDWDAMARAGRIARSC